MVCRTHPFHSQAQVSIQEKANNPSHAAVIRIERLPFDHLGELLTSVDSTTDKTTLMCGVFWPIAVYKAKFGKEPPKDKLEYMKHNGVKHRGLRLEPELGNPIGTFLVQQEGGRGVRLEKCIEDSTKAARGQAQVSETHRAAQSKLSLTISAKDGSKDVSVCGAKSSKDFDFAHRCFKL